MTKLIEGIIVPISIIAIAVGMVVCTWNALHWYNAKKAQKFYGMPAKVIAVRQVMTNRSLDLDESTFCEFVLGMENGRQGTVRYIGYCTNMPIANGWVCKIDGKYIGEEQFRPSVMYECKKG